MMIRTLFLHFLGCAFVPDFSSNTLISIFFRSSAVKLLDNFLSRNPGSSSVCFAPGPVKAPSGRTRQYRNLRNGSYRMFGNPSASNTNIVFLRSIQAHVQALAMRLANPCVARAQSHWRRTGGSVRVRRDSGSVMRTCSSSSLYRVADCSSGG